MFSGRQLAIATKHRKEQVIAPIVETRLGAQCIVTELLDTDQLGTFSGEIERQQDPLNTARMKCKLAFEETGCDLAIASEGSFGPHPQLGFVAVNQELLLFIDKKNGFEISVNLLSRETNFYQSEVKNIPHLREIAQKVNFPSHALILRKSAGDTSDLIKGIVDWDSLMANAHRMLDQYGFFYLETDMRAHLNPTRMRNIEKAAQELVDKIETQCPKCAFPGFGLTRVTHGLPCSWCGSPTRSILSHIRECESCHYILETKFPGGKENEDPMYCDYCNP